MKYYSSWLATCLCVLLVCIHFDGCLACLEEERLALLEIKATTSSDELVSWVDDKGSDCCAWQRVKCNNATPRRVIQLTLNATVGNSLLNASMFLPFHDLQHLDLSDNYISDWHPHQGILFVLCV